MHNKFNNICKQDYTNDDADLVVEGGVAGNINQEIAANIVAESTETANTTCSQATHK